jgi:hypothetical protein
MSLYHPFKNERFLGRFSADVEKKKCGEKVPKADSVSNLHVTLI